MSGKLPKAFKSKGVERMRDFSAVPAGEYICKITDSDYKENSKKTGHFLSLTFEIQNKEFKGSKFFANLNLDNPNEKAVEIAQSELASICDAIGLDAVKDTAKMHGILMIAKLKIKDDKNEVVSYSKLEEGDDADADYEEDVDDDKEDSNTEVSADSVTALAKKYKDITSKSKMQDILSEYEVEKVKEIKDLDEDDLESLSEDLEEAIEDEEG